MVLVNFLLHLRLLYKPTSKFCFILLKQENNMNMEEWVVCKSLKIEKTIAYAF